MRVATYGDHAEAAAAALNRLIVTENIPAAPGAVAQMLDCRQVVVDALRQRLYAFGLNTHFPADNMPVPASHLRLAGLDHRLGTLLDVIAFEVPSTPVDLRKPPSEVLARASAHPTVELWRHAATELLAGSHALDAATDRSWLRDYGGGWYLLRDVAVAMEAFLVLDDRLAQVGLLTQHQHPEPTIGLEEQRLIASQCSRVATWFATSDAPDHAAPKHPGERPVIGPVCLVSTPADLAPAQRRLGTFLRPIQATDVTYLGEPEITADSARHLVSSQAFLNRCFAELAAAAPKATSLAAEFNSRCEILQEIQPQLRYLIDVKAHDLNRHRMWQQGEITAAVRRMQRDQVDFSLPPAQVLDLANATHEVTHNLARSLRRELLRDNSNLRIADPSHQVGATRVLRGSRLEASLTDLINQPAPSTPLRQFSSPLQREALRRTLDVTPTRPRPPSPYPAARSLAAPDCPPPGF